jgi:hypothetical protein
MPTSYTSLLGLALPATGELSGTWGTTVNDYISQYVDAAVAGAQTISGSQTAVTLSTTNGGSLVSAGSGATGSSQYAIINCTGNPAGLLTITAPAASKAYLVLNNTSTNQSVKVVGTGPTTGVTVAAARSALIAWNGSDFELVASTDVSTLSGVLAVANGGTGQSSLTANNVILGNGTSAVQFVAPGTSGNVLTSNGTTWSSTAPAVTLAGNNAFTGANTFYNATGQTFGTATSSQDGVIVAGRAGGSSSYRVTLQPTTLTASRTLTLPDASTTVTGTDATQTLTNKRINPRVVAASGTSGSLTINGDTTDLYKAEGLTGAITFLQPSGTPVDGQRLMIRIEDNGTSRGITWTTSAGAFRAVGITLPTATTLGKVTYVGCVYNSTDSFWDAVATVTQA